MAQNQRCPDCGAVVRAPDTFNTVWSYTARKNVVYCDEHAAWHLAGIRTRHAYAQILADYDDIL